MRLLSLIFLLVVFLSAPVYAQDLGGCAATERVSDWGIRYHFEAGRFIEAPEGNWTHFLTEPEVREISDQEITSDRLQTGDRIVAVDGDLITSRVGSQRFFRARERTTFRIRRQGRLLDVDLLPGQKCSPGPLTARTDPDEAWLGFRLRCEACRLDDDRSWYFTTPPVVTAVAEGSPAADAGFQIGDILVRIDGDALTSPDGGRRLGSLRPGDRVSWHIQRGSDSLDVTLVVGSHAR